MECYDWNDRNMSPVSQAKDASFKQGGISIAYIPRRLNKELNTQEQ